MTPALRNLIAVVSVLAVGGGLVYTYAPRERGEERVTFAQLRDAGLDGCAKRVLVSVENLSDRTRNVLLDAGAQLRPHQTRARTYRTAWRCDAADGGYEYVVPSLRHLSGDKDDDEGNPTGYQAIKAKTCASTPTHNCAGGPNEVSLAVAADDPPPCKRRQPDAGVCTLLDGGDPGMWNVLDAARLTGAGCVGVECSVTAGENPDEVL